MFRRVPPESTDVAPSLSQFSDELVGHVYRGVLNREPEAGGLATWSSFLRNGGQLDEMLRQTLASREFIDQFPRRLAERIDPQDDLPQPSQRLAIVSDCQGDTLAHVLQALAGCRLPPHRFVTWADLRDPRRLVEPLRAFAASHDRILMQPDLAADVLQHAGDLREKIELFPSIRFGGFQPDLSYVYAGERGREVAGPLGVDHSTSAFYGWRAGMSVRETLDHFRDDVYEALRFYDTWAASSAVLLAEGDRAGLPLTGLLTQWRARGCFMHSYNHPKLAVMVDVAQALLRRLNIESLPINATDFVHDLMSLGAGWPVYPEIARRLGVPGSYLFKPVTTGITLRAPLRLIDLEQFVRASFEAYRSTGSDTLICDRPFSARYQNVFGSAARSRGRVTVSQPEVITPRAPSAPHPYSTLPSTRFWSRAVAARPMAEMDPVTAPTFRFSPQTRVMTAGSCFAQHIARALIQRGCNHLIGESPPAELTADEAVERQFGIYSARYGNLYTPRQLVQLVLRALGRFVPAEPAWLRPDGRWADPFRPEIEPKGFASLEDLQTDRASHLYAVRTLLESVEVFVFTLGLTEAWTSSVDGAVFPLAPGVVAGQHDPQRHAFVNFGFDEVLADLQRFVALLHEVNPAAKVLLTISPVPLAATYEVRHVLAATAYSKSVLRAAAETLCRRHPHCDYFPSYEIVSGHYTRGAYYEPNLRSVTPSGVDHVMRVFFQHYVPDAALPVPDVELMEEAIATNRMVCEEERLDQATLI